MDIPRIYHVYTSNDISCISMYIHGYTMYILCEYTWYIIGYTMYIHFYEYTWNIHRYTMYIPCICRTSTYTWNIPCICVVYTENTGSRCVTRYLYHDIIMPISALASRTSESTSNLKLIFCASESISAGVP